MALLLICAAVYIPLISRLGFYWDDWPSMWFLHFWGPEGFTESFASDRPLLAWIFMLTTPIFGENAAAWQYFSAFTRYLTSLALWWTLSGLWPGKPRMAFIASVLFAVYPGFGQQTIAVTYGNAFLVFFLFIFSLGSMIWALRSRRMFWPLMILSVITSALSMLITEYFYTLELLRPILLWIAMDDRDTDRREKIRKVGFYWAPYLVILLLVLASRIFLNPSPRAEVMIFSNLASSPFSTIVELARTIFQDFFEVNFVAWFQGLDFRYLKDFELNVIALMIAAILTSVLITLAYLLYLNSNNPDPELKKGVLDRKWAWQAVFLGAAAFIVSGWTIWITDLHIELLFPFDRFTIITMVGTALLIAGLIGIADRNRTLQQCPYCNISRTLGWGSFPTKARIPPGMAITEIIFLAARLARPGDQAWDPADDIRNPFQVFQRQFAHCSIELDLCSRAGNRRDAIPDL